MFNVSCHGTREGVVKTVTAAKSPGDKVCQKQAEATKAFIVAEIAALPEKFNGCRVTATGEAHDGGRTMNVTVVPMELSL
jgi:hypothetical protein